MGYNCRKLPICILQQYVQRYCGPFVTAPNTAHIVWRQQLALGGLIGGEAGQYSIQASAGTPSVIYLGRCYQTQTVPINGVPTSCAVCYDLQTGQQYYAIPISQGGVTPQRSPTLRRQRLQLKTSVQQRMATRLSY